MTAARDRYVKSGSDTSSIDTALASEKKRLDYLREIQRLQALASSGGDASDAISRRYMSAASASAFVVGSTGPGAMAASNWLPAGVAAADPEDDFLLAMALAGDADFLLTGDRRAGLLQQGTIGRTRVASPAWFCAEAL